MSLVTKELKIILSIMVVSTFIAVPTAIHAKRNTRASVPYTPNATLRLAVPYHHQEHALSCEAAGLRMLLLNRNIDEPESGIIQRMPFGPMKSDPDRVFVGNIDGRQFVTGYGIHADGLLLVANTYSPAQSFHNRDLNFLIDRLHDGNPVLVWGSTVKYPRHYTWIADGKVVNAVAGEHVWVVTGYAGPRRAPTYIFISDPIAGEKVYHTGDFLNFWAQYDNSGLFFL